MIREAVLGMLPKNKLRKRMVKRLKIYVADQHPHAAQRPNDRIAIEACSLRRSFGGYLSSIQHLGTGRQENIDGTCDSSAGNGQFHS